MGNVMVSMEKKISGDQKTESISNVVVNNQIDQFFKQMQNTLNKNPKDIQSIQRWVGELIRIGA